MSRLAPHVTVLFLLVLSLMPVSTLNTDILTASLGKPVALAYVNAYEKAHGAHSRTQFGAHANDALKVLQRIVPVALKKARPGTPEFRQALRDALETEKEIVVSHGVLNYTASDHIGFDERGRVLLRIDKGQFRLIE